MSVANSPTARDPLGPDVVDHEMRDHVEVQPEPGPLAKGTSRKFDPNAQLPSYENIKRDVAVLLSYAATAGVSLQATDVEILTSNPADTKNIILSQ